MNLEFLSAILWSYYNEFPESKFTCLDIISKLGININPVKLDQNQKKLLVLAIMRYSFIHGPLVFEKIMLLVRKLDIEQLFEEHLKDWIEYATKQVLIKKINGN